MYAWSWSWYKWMSCLMTPVSGQKLILKLSTSRLKLITSVNEIATFTIDFPPHMMGNFQSIRCNKTTRQLDNERTTITRQWQSIPTNGSDNACLHLRSPKSRKHCFLVFRKVWMKILHMDHFWQTHPHKTENLVFFSPFMCNFSLDYSYADKTKVEGFHII